MSVAIGHLSVGVKPRARRFSASFRQLVVSISARTGAMDRIVCAPFTTFGASAAVDRNGCTKYRDTGEGTKPEQWRAANETAKSAASDTRIIINNKRYAPYVNRRCCSLNLAFAFSTDPYLWCRKGRVYSTRPA